MNEKMERKIYIASSWKNDQMVGSLAWVLRGKGYQVFDFTSPECRAEGLSNFVFNANNWKGKDLKKMDYVEFLQHSDTQRAFKSDKAGLDWSNTVILLLPSGRSSHLEAGYGVGQGKDLFILGDLPLGEFDAMYGFAKGCYHLYEISKLYEALRLYMVNRKGVKKWQK